MNFVFVVLSILYLVDFVGFVDIISGEFDQFYQDF